MLGLSEHQDQKALLLIRVILCDCTEYHFQKYHSNIYLILLNVLKSDGSLLNLVIYPQTKVGDMLVSHPSCRRTF